MKKLRIILTLLGVLVGAVGLFSFTTQKKASGNTVWVVSGTPSFSAGNTTITFTEQGTVTSLIEGSGYFCNSQSGAFCTIEHVGSADQTVTGTTVKITNSAFSNPYPNSVYSTTF